MNVKRQSGGAVLVKILDLPTSGCCAQSTEVKTWRLKFPFSDPHFPPCDLFTPSQSDTAVSTAALPVSESPAESSLLYGLL